MRFVSVGEWSFQRYAYVLRADRRMRFVSAGMGFYAGGYMCFMPVAIGGAAAAGAVKPA